MTMRDAIEAEAQRQVAWRLMRETCADIRAWLRRGGDPDLLLSAYRTLARRYQSWREAREWQRRG